MAARRKTRQEGAQLGVMVKGGVGKDDPHHRLPLPKAASPAGLPLDWAACTRLQCRAGRRSRGSRGPLLTLSRGAGAPPWEGEPDALLSTSLGHE